MPRLLPVANDHAPPLRSEPIVNKNGIPTFRHADFLEKLGETSDDSSNSNEDTPQILAELSGSTGANRARINDQSRSIGNIDQLISSLLADNGKLRAGLRAHSRDFEKLAQLVNQLIADNAQLRARLNEKDRQIENINQEMASN